MLFIAKYDFGFVYEPSTENEVVLLFGVLTPYVGSFLEKMGFGSNFLIEEWTENPTDCVMEVDGKKIRVEFELYSSHFRGNHDPDKCDLIICWKNNWVNSPHNIKILELKMVCEKIAAEKGIQLVLNKRPKHMPRSSPWTEEEFMHALKKNVGEDRFKIFQKFFEEIGSLKGVILQTGIGKKIPTMQIGFEKLGVFPLVVDALGRVSIAYYNVGRKPPVPFFPADLIERIWIALGAPKTKEGEMKKWHYIKASDSNELTQKLKDIINMVLETAENSNKLSNQFVP